MSLVVEVFHHVQDPGLLMAGVLRLCGELAAHPAKGHQPTDEENGDALFWQGIPQHDIDRDEHGQPAYPSRIPCRTSPRRTALSGNRYRCECGR